MKRAFITGVTGQDGSYLAEWLLSKGYQVHGLVRRASLFNTQRISPIFQDPHETTVNLYLHYGDLLDASLMHQLIAEIKPDEVYNLAAQSHVRVSFDMPRYTADTIVAGTVNLLEAIRREKPDARFYQAASSEVFGKAQEVPQRETTPFWPRSPYGVSKAAAYWFTVNYRESFKLFAANGILFNHEGPRRGETFVTRKITRGLAEILAGRQQRIFLGNLEARRDWGYAKEYVEGIWRILQAEAPSDYVLATGETHSVREFLQTCCDILGLDAAQVVSIDPRYLRPAEVDLLVGDSTKAKRQLGWEPKARFNDLVRLMLAADLEASGLDPAKYGLAASEDKAVISG
ncbi:MAG: GDP-mannose 4,6-dehydratase [Chloroflexi bacterium]|nr:GDP-mannose 4,6-dehydratase [Chloroflexota bacterium]